VTGLADWLADWSPPAQRWSGQVTGWSVGAFAGLLDQPEPGLERPVVPPMWQLFGCLAHPAQAELGPDGHPLSGPFMPPIPDRRRMFAGGRWRETRPLPVDARIDCAAEVVSVRVTTGRSGELAFVTVRTRYSVDGEPSVQEEQDLVYRSQPDAPPGQRTGTNPAVPVRPSDGAPAAEVTTDHQLTLTPDRTLLFRFSALTYNAHRIHYDEAYATGVEGHPGLVVHGPLLALLALEVPRRNDPSRRVVEFDYRLRRPAFLGDPLGASGRPDPDWELAVGVPGGAPSLTATARSAGVPS
jgi:3-methylfumaryl-CoA hydratase